MNCKYRKKKNVPIKKNEHIINKQIKNNGLIFNIITQLILSCHILQKQNYC